MRHVRVVMGLGNPGREFEGTRHNLGAVAVKMAAEKRGLKMIPSLRSHSLLAEEQDISNLIAFALPQTFMNDSGRALTGLAKRYKLKSLEDLVVVHDELDLPPGVVKVKRGGGVAGHRGLTSIVASANSSDFVRVRIGIGRPTGGHQVRDYVLERLKPSERDSLNVALEVASDAVNLILDKGVDIAMNEINGN
ncbi:MAG: aminoacyl-tRNA hydrolase [Actinomycetota bacterium]|nr:aminoacyl-tRNA hydrolase [Actinomycetota bacterium]